MTELVPYSEKKRQVYKPKHKLAVSANTMATMERVNLKSTVAY